MIPDAFGSIISTTPLYGGCVSDVSLVETNRGRFVVKMARGVDLSIEAAMLRTLQETDVPVPDVLFDDSQTLVLSYVESNGVCGTTGEVHAAELLAALHRKTGPRFGFAYDTLIGGLPQPNPMTDSWIDFFGTHRALNMTDQAIDGGRLSSNYRGRMEKLVEQLPDLVSDSSEPSLIHGDIWSGNVLFHDGRVAALIDPAVYWANSEIELAFIKMFSTFGRTFFDTYHSINSIEPGFQERSAVYNIYPTLVHVRLFGGGYVSQLDATLRRFGC